MAQRAPLVLRVGVVASSLLLVTGFIGYRTGYLFSNRSVTSDSPLSSASPLAIDPALVATAPNDPQGEDSQQSLSETIGSGIQVKPQSWNATSAVGVMQATPRLQSNTQVQLTLPQDQLDALRRRPGKASDSLIEHDAMESYLTLSSSSKSIVLLPQQPDDREKVINDYKSKASTAFSKRDQDGNGKLTASELGEFHWRHFEKMGAVENGAVDTEGFLKNYSWYVRQK